MVIKSADANWLTGYKWFGCFVKENNLLKDQTCWYYDVKQLPVDSGNNLKMEHELPSIHVITNPFNTSALAASAVSSGFKEYVEYEDEDVSGGLPEAGHLYIETSTAGFWSAGSGGGYMVFPWVNVSSRETYAKGFSHYKATDIDEFDSWDIEASKGMVQESSAFSAGASSAYYFNPRPASGCSGAGAKTDPPQGFIYNFPHSNGRHDRSTDSSGDPVCTCCDGWSLEWKGRLVFQSHLYRVPGPSRTPVRYFCIYLHTESCKFRVAYKYGCDEGSNMKYVKKRIKTRGEKGGTADGPSIDKSNCKFASAKSVKIEVWEEHSKCKDIENLNCGDEVQNGIASSGITGVSSTQTGTKCGEKSNSTAKVMAKGVGKSGKINIPGHGNVEGHDGMMSNVPGNFLTEAEMRALYPEIWGNGAGTVTKTYFNSQMKKNRAFREKALANAAAALGGALFQTDQGVTAAALIADYDCVS